MLLAHDTGWMLEGASRGPTRTRCLCALWGIPRSPRRLQGLPVGMSRRVIPCSAGLGRAIHGRRTITPGRLLTVGSEVLRTSGHRIFFGLRRGWIFCR